MLHSAGAFHWHAGHVKRSPLCPVLIIQAGAAPTEAKRGLLEAISLVPNTGVYGVQVSSGLTRQCSSIMHAGMQWHRASQSTERKIIGQEEERQRILSLVEALEAGNPLHAPTEHLDRVHGTWRLLFSTITILVRYA